MPKNVTRTVRLEDVLDRAIQEKAKEANTSVNFLVNRLIRKYVDWDLPGEKFGLGPVASSLVNRLFDEIDDKSAYELGRSIAHDFYEPYATYLFGELTFETSILLFRRASDYGGRYTFDSNSDKRVFQGVYSEILKMEVKVESTKEYCVVRLAAVASA